MARPASTLVVKALRKSLGQHELASDREGCPFDHELAEAIIEETYVQMQLLIPIVEEMEMGMEERQQLRRLLCDTNVHIDGKPLRELGERL